MHYSTELFFINYLDHSYGMDSHEDNAGELLQRIIDLEESDKETSSLIVFLFMQYMSRPEHVI